MENEQSGEFSVDKLQTYKTYIDQAIDKINGITIHDLPESAPYQGDDWDPLITLSLSLDSIAQALKTSYTNPAQQKKQAEIHQSYLALVEAAKTRPNARHLVEKYESVIRPQLYNTDKLTTLVNHLHQAQEKLHGNNSFDQRSVSSYGIDNYDPLDRLALSFDTLVEVLDATYATPDYKKIQSQIASECRNLLNETERRKVFISEPYFALVNVMENKYGFKLEKKELDGDSRKVPPF